MTLLGRVTRLTVLMAGLAAASVAIVSSLIADALIVRAEDRHLSGVLQSLAVEVPDDEREVWLGEERRELAFAGLDVRFGNATQGCITQDAARMCATPVKGAMLILREPLENVTAHRPIFAISALVAVLTTMLVAALASRRLASWAVRFDEEMAQTRRFAANAAHELRTPLATMRARLELLVEELGGEQKGAAARVHATLLQVQALMDRLLILATDAEGMREVVSLHEVAEAALADLPGAARVSVQTNDELLTITGDFHLLKTLVSNAIDNALKFSGQEPVVLRISQRASDAVMRIEDRGPGIAASEAERVFDAFYRSADARASGVAGHGIGLALIAHVARAHGGSARFVSAERGATLEVVLPATGRGSAAATRS